MASSKKPLSNKVKVLSPKNIKQPSLLKLVERALIGVTQSYKKIKSVTVALSGGIDSVVLLYLLYTLKNKHHFKLKAAHVHHGLSQNADKWVKFCEKLCTKLSVPLDIHYIQLPKKKSLGIEGEARQLRYEKLLQSKSDLVVLAHHADDQAETFLLQLIRGAGVKGLSSMASFDEARRLWRPLLNSSRFDIESYAKQHKLKWIEDESNQNIDFDRNFIRSKVLPIFKDRFSHIVKVISRSSSHLAEAQILLDDLAQIDLKTQPKSIEDTYQLHIKVLYKLSPSRAKNVLRYWLEINDQMMPSKDLLEELLRQILTAKKDAALKITLTKNHEIRRYQNKIYIVSNNQITQKNYEIVWSGESAIVLPNGTQVTFKKVKGKGIALDLLKDKKITISNRKGGESFKPDIKRPTKKIKQLLQESHFPPWEREKLPLIFVGKDLVCVPQIGIQHTYKTHPSKMGLEVTCEL